VNCELAEAGGVPKKLPAAVIARSLAVRPVTLLYSPETVMLPRPSAKFGLSLEIEPL
jgi:hypothetical protein